MFSYVIHTCAELNTGQDIDNTIACLKLNFVHFEQLGQESRLGDQCQSDLTNVQTIQHCTRHVPRRPSRPTIYVGDGKKNTLALVLFLSSFILVTRPNK